MNKFFLILLILILCVFSIVSCKNIEKQENNAKIHVEQSNVKFGLEENERKQLFKDIVNAEDRANKYQRLAEDKILDLKLSKQKLKIEYEKIANESEIVMRKYKVEVLEKYKVTEEQEIEISKEGFSRKWPLD